VTKRAVFCSFVMLLFPGVLFRYFLNNFEMVPVAPVIIGYNFSFYIPHTPYFCCKILVLQPFQLLS
jgi:hypothetical protein